MTDNIASRAMLVYLNVSQATFRKLDKGATQEVTSNHAAASDAGRFNKQVIPKEALLPIQQVANAARIYLYDHTLPWSDNGDRALSSTNYFKVMDQLQKFKQQFDAEVDIFCQNYNQHRDRARLKLNSLFKDSDYPHEFEVRQKFAFNFGVLPLPTAGDFRVEMAGDEVDAVRAEIAAQLNARADAMMATVWDELKGTISHLKDRLQSSGKLFDSTLGNVEDLVERLPGLNITNDAGLDQIRSIIKQTFQGLTMKDIKKDEQLRKATADRCDDILKQMAGLI